MKPEDWIVKFKSEHEWPADSAVQRVLNTTWNLTDVDHMHKFFDLQKLSYMEYAERFNDRDSVHHENILLMQKESNYIPYWYNASETKRDHHLTWTENGNVCYIDRGSDVTIVVFNNHAIWIDAIYGAEKQRRYDLHYYNWLSTTPELKDYNFISITEELSQVNKNPLVYPSWFMRGFNVKHNTPEKTVNYVKRIFGDSEYRVYSPCKNSLIATHMASLLNATRVFMEHGSTTFHTADLTGFSYMMGETEYHNYDQCYDNIFFQSMCREKFFNAHLFDFDSVEDIIAANKKCKYLFYETTQHKSLGYLKYWADFVRNLKYKNLKFKRNKFTEPKRNQVNIRRSAISFFK